MHVSSRWDSRKRGARRPRSVGVLVTSSASVPQNDEGRVSLTLNAEGDAGGSRPALYLDMEVAEAEDLRDRLQSMVEWCRLRKRLHRLEGRRFELDGVRVELAEIAPEVPPDRWDVIEQLEVGQVVQLAGGASGDAPLKRVA